MGEHANNFLDFFHLWQDWWIWPVDYMVRFWSIFAVTLILNFQGQIWNLLYLSQKWSDCHERKSRHIDWTIGLKQDHWVWPWPWLWLWIFKIKYGICHISQKWSDCCKTESKPRLNCSLKCHQVWPWTWPWKVRCKDLPKSDWGDFRCQCSVNSSRFFFS